MAPPAAPARALLAVVRLAHAEVDHVALVTDDVPELVIATEARWCEGTATDTEVRVARRNVYAPRPSLDDKGPTRVLLGLAWELAAYVGGGPGTGREKYVESALYNAVCCLTWTGEAKDAATSRVEATYEAAMLGARGSTVRRDIGQ